MIYILTIIIRLISVINIIVIIIVVLFGCSCAVISIAGKTRYPAKPKETTAITIIIFCPPVSIQIDGFTTVFKI